MIRHAATSDGPARQRPARRQAGAGNLAAFLDNAKKYFLKLLAVTVLIILVFAIIAIIFSVIIGILPQAVKPFLALLIVPVSIALAILFVMPSYALVASDLGIVESIKKGVTLGKDNFLKILGIFGIMILVLIGIMLVASVLSAVLSLLFRPAASYISAIIMAIANTAWMLLMNIAYMDFYLKS